MLYMLTQCCSYHVPSPEAYRVVGVLVWPFRCGQSLVSILIDDMLSSIGGSQSGPATCDTTTTERLRLSEDHTQVVRYTYRVMWNVSLGHCFCLLRMLNHHLNQESSTPWVQRLTCLSIISRE